jgi:outer membrane lipoprotein
MKIVNLSARHPKLIALAFLSVFVATGCTIVPEPIDVAKNESLVPFEQISAITQQAVNQETTAPASISQIGEKARWGGKIVSVENKKEFSEIEVVFFPENSFGKPRTGQPSIGRFKAVVKGFVDPVVFEQGRLITVVGEIGDAQTGIIGEQEYNYPTLNAMGYHMWKQTSEVQVDTFAFAPFGYYAGFNRGFFSPWYDPWHFRSQRHRIRLTHNNGHEQSGRVRGGISPRTPNNIAPPVRNTQLRNAETKINNPNRNPNIKKR